MQITNFQFNQTKLSDFDCIIAYFDNSSDEVSGGTTEYDSVKAPNSDKFKFYGSQFNEVLTWNFSIIKNPCFKKETDMKFSHSEERKIMKWLKRTDGYKWFNFIEDDSEEKIYYQVKVDVNPHRIGGKTLGYDLTVTSNCAYGFTDIITKHFFISPEHSFTFSVDTDMNEYIYPEEVTIKNNTVTSFYLENSNDIYRTGDTSSHFTNIPEKSTLVLDCDNQIITGLTSPDNFNWYFPRLVDRDNKFIVTTKKGEIEITMQYREARMVVI